MKKVGTKEVEGVMCYSELDTKRTALNGTGVIVKAIFGVVLNSFDFILVDNTVARIVTVSDN
jgi:hypothetical protein